jgi:glycosyltransferase involved in cell wall biosynthesis
MKIAEVLGPPLFLTGLGQTRIIPIAKELIKKGHKICVFTPTTKFEKVETFFIDGIPIVKTGQFFISSEDEFGFSKDCKRHQSYKILLKILAWVFITIREVKKFEPDIIQIYTSLPNTMMFFPFARICFPATPIYLDYDDLYGGKGGSLDYRQVNPILIRILGIIEHILPLFANKLSVCSQFLSEKFNSDIIIPNSVDTNLLKHNNNLCKKEMKRLKHFRIGLGVEPDDKLILIASRINDIYDYDMVIQAVEKVYKTHKGIKVVVVGDGEGLENLKKLMKEANLEHIVFFKGFVKESKLLRDYYHISDICIIPMRERKSHLARCPIKLLEGIAAQLCMIVPDYGECKHILDNLHNALFYKVGDINDLSSKILQVLENPELEIHLRKNIAQLANTFDHKQVACSWDKHFKNEQT